MDIGYLLGPSGRTATIDTPSPVAPFLPPLFRSHNQSKEIPFIRSS